MNKSHLWHLNRDLTDKCPIGDKSPIGHFEWEIGDWGLGKNIEYFSNSSRTFLKHRKSSKTKPGTHKCTFSYSGVAEDVKEGDEVVNGHPSGRQWRRSSAPSLVRA